MFFLKSSKHLPRFCILKFYLKWSKHLQLLGSHFFTFFSVERDSRPPQVRKLWCLKDVQTLVERKRQRRVVGSMIQDVQVPLQNEINETSLEMLGPVLLSISPEGFLDPYRYILYTLESISKNPGPLTACWSINQTYIYISYISFT